MELEFLGSWLASDDGLAVHLAVFIALILGGLGFPIPEDIPLLLAGVAAGKSIVSLRGIWLTAYSGVLLADQVLYWAGYFFGKRLLDAGTRSPFFSAITDEKVEKVRDGLRKRRLVIIFIGRHLFPVRSVTFLCAGALHVPYLEFLFADALAALISVSIVVGLGYWLGERLDAEVMEHFLHQAHIYILILVLFSLAYWWVRRKKKKKAKLAISEAARAKASADSTLQADSNTNDSTNSSATQVHK